MRPATPRGEAELDRCLSSQWDTTPDAAERARAFTVVCCQGYGEIGPGLLLLVGVTHSDTAADADKVWNLRIFADSDGVMNLSVADTSRSVLVVSQFTLHGDTRRGRRRVPAPGLRPAGSRPGRARWCSSGRC